MKSPTIRLLTPQQLIAKTQAVVVYDLDTGKVVHVHYHTSFGSGPLPSDADLKRSAIKIAADGPGSQGQHLEALRVKATEIVRGMKFRVDPSRKRLVEVEPPSPKVGSSAPKRGIGTKKRTRRSSVKRKLK